MGDITADLLSLPLFHGLATGQIEALLAECRTVQLDPDEVIFHEGGDARHLTLLIEGEIRVSNSDGVDLCLNPPAVLGELGVVTGLVRFRTATTMTKCLVRQISRTALLAFLEASPAFAFTFHQNLLCVVSDKVTRDQKRLEDMRDNIVRTQKAMKQLRSYVLEELDTPISEDVHDTLDELIARNRRVNYRVMPPRPLAVSVRTGSGEIHPVVAISRTRLTLRKPVSSDDSDSWRGVLVLPHTEIPVDGTQHIIDSETVDIELEHMIDEYVESLEDYLTRAQSLDVLF